MPSVFNSSSKPKTSGECVKNYEKKMKIEFIFVFFLVLNLILVSGMRFLFPLHRETETVKSTTIDQTDFSFSIDHRFS